MKAALVFFALAAVSAAAPAAETPVPPTIVFLGDSLTAGFGVGPSENFPALIAARLEERGWKFRVVNRGRSGDTSGDALDRHAGWARPPLDVLVVALGTNDASQRVPPARVEKNLRRIVEKAYAVNKRVRIVVVGARPPREWGAYARRFDALFRRVAWEYRTAYLPFLLEDVVDVPALTLADRIHPNADGHKVIADNVWGVLEPILKKAFPAAAPSEK